ncbi:MAG: DNA polymerase III subunit gamma/tau [Erysipelotrichaceae bacterium]|nr:DNA polymerase III subunit gamma/tau [Erysipelotrichaceae bacterium]
MSYQVLYRTYRPKRFEEVVGQEYIIKTLKNAIKLNKIAHAYLFAGPRGTGKTTIAKLFAKAINCESFKEEACDECDSCKAFKENMHPDIVELDAASNNGVDNIREIIDQVSYAPMLGKYKVYIIDEVHMLSSSAFNALLKTLEEPPAHVVFILATTDPQKIIPTVLSRCQRYNFSKIANFNIKKKLKEVLESEKINYEDKALDEVAVLAEGGMRDALSLLEQILSYNNEGVYLEDIQKIFGLSSNEEKVKLLLNIHNKNISEVISTLRDMYQIGIDTKRLAVDLLEIIKEALIYSDNAEEKLLRRINKLEAMEILDHISVKTLLSDANNLEELIYKTRANHNFLNYLELCFIKMAGIREENTVVRENIRVEAKSESVKPVEEVKTLEPVKPVEEVKEEVRPEPVQEEVKPTPVEKVEEKTEQESIVEKTVEKVIKEEFPVEEEEKEVVEEVDLNYLATLLLTASKDEKINDAIIYNKLELYKYEPDNRKFYELLNNTELFASGHDAIIIVADHMRANNINSKETKNALYNFLVTEHGIDKVVFAIEEKDKMKLVSIYKQLIRDRSQVSPGTVVKPEIVKEKTKEEKLREMFSNVRVEE